MNGFDGLILMVLAALVGWALYGLFKPGKKHGCGPAGCAGCSASCADRSRKGPAVPARRS